MNKRLKIILGVIIFLAVAYVAFETIQVNRAKAMLAEGLAAFDNDKDCDALRSGVIGSRSLGYRMYIFRLPYDSEERQIGEARSDFCFEIQQVDRLIAEQDYAGAILHHQETLTDLQVGKRAGIGGIVTEKIVDEFSKLIEDQLAKIDEKSQPEDWATLETCLGLNDLLDVQVIPNPEGNLPGLYMACGEVFGENGRYGEASTMYRHFLDDYATHELAKQVKDQLALVLLAEAAESGGGSIGQPQLIGTREKDSAVLIQNDSSYEITMVFSGIENRVETLQPCPDCRTTEEADCSDTAAIEVYVLPPGTYEVVVNAESDRIRPFRGTWTLKTGEEYFTCFYISESFSP